MLPNIASCKNFCPLKTAIIAYIQRKIQLSGFFFAYPDGSPFQLIMISGILLYKHIEDCQVLMKLWLVWE